MKKLTYLLPILTLCACAGGTGPVYNAGHVQPNKVQIVIYRPYSIISSGYTPHMKINGIDVCDLALESYDTIDTDPGTVTVTAGHMMGNTITTITAHAGDRYYFKVSPNHDYASGAIMGGIPGIAAANMATGKGTFVIDEIGQQQALQDLSGVKHAECK